MCVDGTMTSRPVAFERMLKRAPTAGVLRLSHFAHKARVRRVAPKTEARRKGYSVAEQRTDTDWVAIERSPEFQELTRKKRAFIVPATVFFMTWYFGFIFLTGYAPDFMGKDFHHRRADRGLRARA